MQPNRASKRTLARPERLWLAHHFNRAPAMTNPAILLPYMVARLRRGGRHLIRRNRNNRSRPHAPTASHRSGTVEPDLRYGAQGRGRVACPPEASVMTSTNWLA